MINLLDFVSTYKVLNNNLNMIYSFELYKSEFAYGISNERFNLIKSSRQIGMSTLLQSTSAYYLLNNFDVLFISDFKRNGYSFINNVKIILDYHKTILNDVGLNESLAINSGKEWININNNRIRLCSSPNQLRGWNHNNSIIIFDNSSNIDNLEEFIRDIIITNPHKIILVGTNNLENNYFTTLYNRNNNLWNKINLPYTSCSRILTKENELRTVMGDERFNIEFGLM